MSDLINKACSGKVEYDESHKGYKATVDVHIEYDMPSIWGGNQTSDFTKDCYNGDRSRGWWLPDVFDKEEDAHEWVDRTIREEMEKDY